MSKATRISLARPTAGVMRGGASAGARTRARPATGIRLAASRLVVSAIRYLGLLAHQPVPAVPCVARHPAMAWPALGPGHGMTSLGAWLMGAMSEPGPSQGPSATGPGPRRAGMCGRDVRPGCAAGVFRGQGVRPGCAAGVFRGQGVRPGCAAGVCGRGVPQPGCAAVVCGRGVRPEFAATGVP